jgi:hypothetical protein
MTARVLAASTWEDVSKLVDLGLGAEDSRNENHNSAKAHRDLRGRNEVFYYVSAWRPRSLFMTPACPQAILLLEHSPRGAKARNVLTRKIKMANSGRRETRIEDQNEASEGTPPPTSKQSS